MAIIYRNNQVEGARGRIGPFVYRNFNGKTVVSKRPIPTSAPPSAAKKATNSNFTDASAYAVKCMADPGLKAYYKTKAKKLKLPNGYTAALTDHLRKGKIDGVNRTDYTGKARQEIVVEIEKEGFSMKAVSIRLTTKGGVLIEEGAALEKIPHCWTYKTTVAAGDEKDVLIAVSAVDTNGMTVFGAGF